MQWSKEKGQKKQNNLQTIPELKRAITATIRLEECVHVIDSFARRAQVWFWGHSWSTYCKGCKAKIVPSSGLKLDEQVVHGQINVH